MLELAMGEMKKVKIRTKFSDTLIDNKFYTAIDGYIHISLNNGLQFIFKEGYEVSKIENTPSKDYSIVFYGLNGYQNGYGRASISLGLALSLFKRTKFIPRNDIYDTKFGGASLDNLFKTEINDLDFVPLIFTPGNYFKGARKAFSGPTVGYTMFEAYPVPKNWVEIINNEIDLLFVPTLQNKEIFIGSGVNIPVEVVPIPVDSKNFSSNSNKILQKDGNNEFIFGIGGTLTYRKGVDLAIKAFYETFYRNGNVKLIIKTTKTGLFNPFVESSIIKDLLNSHQLVIINEDLENMNDFYNSIDCFLFPTRGEGFGLPTLEALMAGVPVITNKNTGWVHDFFCGKNKNIKDAGIFLNSTNVPVPNDQLGRGFPENLRAPNQIWYEVSLNDLKGAMEEVYKNHEFYKNGAKKVKNSLVQLFSYKTIGRKAVKFLNEFLLK